MYKSAVFFLLLFSSCTSSVDKFVAPNLFLKENRGALYAEFYQVVKTDSVCINCERAYVFDDTSTTMGKFTAEVKKICSNAEVTFFNKFRESFSYHPRILISPGGKECLEDFDKIQFDTFKLFKIEKYEKGVLDIMFQVGNDLIKPSDLRIANLTKTSPFHVVIYVKTDLDSLKVKKDLENYEVLKSFFGEEFMIKKVQFVTFKFVKTFSSSLLTIQEYAKRFVAVQKGN